MPMQQSEEDAGDLVDLTGRRILITGGTGMIGSALLPYLHQRGCVLGVITRDPHAAQRRFSLPVRWFSRADSIGPDEHYDTVINLAGESLAQGRWTAAKKRRLYAVGWIPRRRLGPG